MTNQEINDALAIYCGAKWKMVMGENGRLLKSLVMPEDEAFYELTDAQPDLPRCQVNSLPNFCEDLNAQFRVIKRMPVEVWARYQPTMPVQEPLDQAKGLCKFLGIWRD